jgi:hypothetical protein
MSATRLLASPAWRGIPGWYAAHAHRAQPITPRRGTDHTQEGNHMCSHHCW